MPIRDVSVRQWGWSNEAEGLDVCATASVGGATPSPYFAFQVGASIDSDSDRVPQRPSQGSEGDGQQDHAGHKPCLHVNEFSSALSQSLYERRRRRLARGRHQRCSAMSCDASMTVGFARTNILSRVFVCRMLATRDPASSLAESIGT